MINISLEKNTLEETFGVAGSSAPAEPPVETDPDPPYDPDEGGDW